MFTYFMCEINYDELLILNCIFQLQKQNTSQCRMELDIINKAQQNMMKNRKNPPSLFTNVRSKIYKIQLKHIYLSINIFRTKFFNPSFVSLHEFGFIWGLFFSSVIIVFTLSLFRYSYYFCWYCMLSRMSSGLGKILIMFKQIHYFFFLSRGWNYASELTTQFHSSMLW